MSDLKNNMVIVWVVDVKVKVAFPNFWKVTCIISIYVCACVCVCTYVGQATLEVIFDTLSNLIEKI